MDTERKQRMVHLFFDIGVIAKGIDGVLEIVGGALLFLISPMQLDHIVRILTQHELTEDPHDLVANYILHSVQGLSAGAKMFGAIYLLWHGVVKVGLVAALLLRRRWAYPVAIVAFLLFLVYQLYRYSHTYAPELLVLSVLDVVVIVLTWLEYRRLRGSHAFASRVHDTE
jgi:uncharacterized membrane protein